ncbi:MAG: AAA15 family ATPase/GTPase, partial [Flammeovirgaceae bacterium]
MLENLHIKNFKSIADESIDLGRINVFIGENGSGKSNILEALMMASLAETYGIIDADILYTNGVRVSKPSLMMSNFEGKEQMGIIKIQLKYLEESTIYYDIEPLEALNIESEWERLTIIKENQLKKALEYLKKNENSSKTHEQLSSEYIREEEKSKGKMKSFLSNFIIYTLNTEALRGIPEFQKSRKGIYGETLDKIIASLSESELEELKEHVYGKIEWLDDFFIDKKDELKRKGYKMSNSQSLLYFKDKHMSEEGNNNLFSAENSNEGILHLLFYLANIISTKTSKLFAIDNIETGLNPRLCEHTMEEICTLAKKHDKQILITTHNPAILDGLNLLDDEI